MAIVLKKGIGQLQPIPRVWSFQSAINEKDHPSPQRQAGRG
jgi:hypothetical protein